MARPRDPLARSALIAAARSEFVRFGIQKARIEDITQACGLSKGAFYLHFESKEALFRELVDEFERQLEAVSAAREQGWVELLNRGVPRGKSRLPFISKLLQLGNLRDCQLLELLWVWRDVTDVLLRGSQGTEFEKVMWAMLDREVERVERECAALKKAALMRSEVPTSVIGPMIVGTYLLVGRRMARLSEKPDFAPWVQALQSALFEGIAPSVRPFAKALSRAAPVASPGKKRRRALPRKVSSLRSSS